jgi:type IV secretion system protein VirD4
MIGASGMGKTAFFLYPNLEYACASGMSFLCTGHQGRSVPQLRSTIARLLLRLQHVSVIDPAQSDPLGRQQPADTGQPLHG